MRVKKDEALKRLEEMSPELCQATRTVLLAFPGSRLVRLSKAGSCIKAPEGHYLVVLGSVTVTVESPAKKNFGWSRSKNSTLKAGFSNVLPKKAPAHSLLRKEMLAGNAYQSEIE